MQPQQQQLISATPLQFTASASDPAERSMLSGMSGSLWERAYGGVAAVAFFISNFIALAICCCVVVYIWGLASLPINTDSAFTTSWAWWYMASPAVVAFAPWLVLWLNYQLRKGWAEKGLGSFNTALVNILYFVCTVCLAIIAAWLILCAIWYGIADWIDCASHTRCNGGSSSSTPAFGAIMILCAWGLAALLICVELVLQLYLWYAVRQVITMSVLQSPYAYLAAQIGSEHAATLRNSPLTDEVAAALIRAHRSAQLAGYTEDNCCAQQPLYTALPVSAPVSAPMQEAENDNSMAL